MSGLVRITITGLEKEIALRRRAAETGTQESEVEAERQENKRETNTEMVTLLVQNQVAPAMEAPSVSNGPALNQQAPAIGQPVDTSVNNAGVRGTLSGTLTGTVVDAPVEPQGERHIRSNRGNGLWNGGWFEGDEESFRVWEKRVGENSYIAILGVNSTKCVMDSKQCVVEPPVPQPPPKPLPQVPVPGQPPYPGAGNPRPGSGGTSGPTNESAVRDVVNTIVTTGGTNALSPVQPIS